MYATARDFRYDTDDSLMDKERPLPADPGEDTDEEVTDKKALAKALKLPFRPLWWAALSLLRLGELSSRCLLFALMVVKVGWRGKTGRRWQWSRH